jgi:hypothetical protein
VKLGENARLVAVISDPEFHLSRDEAAALSRRLVKNVRSPLLDVPLEGSPDHALTIVDPTRVFDPDYVLQLASPRSQLLELSLYGRHLSEWPGYRLLAEWLTHHLACEVYLGSDYRQPWVRFDPDTDALHNKLFVERFYHDRHGSCRIGLPWPENPAAGAHAVIAARLGSNRFSPALEFLCATLADHRKYQGQVPIPVDGPAMAIFDVLPEPRLHEDSSIWQPAYRPDDPTFATPHAHRFAVIPTTLPFTDPANLDAWPMTRFLLEVLMVSLGGEPVYGVADESDVAKRPRLLSSNEMTKLTRTYLSAM